ncbi:hypothetical protein PR048_008500 [Dryococelus australis]|uniref:Uncharacterized protein n=1 Tax=Dryococelus australis TaxID=614101 RepID=A0ABQ9HXA4_9NEOP|nr:hypothetical protein PR048_008500 [Dryococelus australis]
MDLLLTSHKSSLADTKALDLSTDISCWLVKSRLRISGFSTTASVLFRLKTHTNFETTKERL